MMDCIISTQEKDNQSSVELGFHLYLQKLFEESKHGKRQNTEFVIHLNN